MKLTFFQPTVMIAKGKLSFATMTHGCKVVIIDKFGWILKIRINQWLWQKKGQCHFSFFKVDSHNLKFNLECLISCVSSMSRILKTWWRWQSYWRWPSGGHNCVDELCDPDGDGRGGDVPWLPAVPYLAALSLDNGTFSCVFCYT